MDLFAYCLNHDDGMEMGIQNCYAGSSWRQHFLESERIITTTTNAAAAATLSGPLTPTPKARRLYAIDVNTSGLGLALVMQSLPPTNGLVHTTFRARVSRSDFGLSDVYVGLRFGVYSLP